MSNRTSLFAVNSADSYEKSYAEEDRKAASELVPIGDVSYRFPLLWLACFRLEDLKHFTMPDEDEEMPYLLTTREQALANLRDSKKYLRKYLACDGYLDQYVELMISVLESYTEQYLVFELWDVATMGDLEDFDQQLRDVYKLFADDAVDHTLVVLEQLSAIDIHGPLYPVKGLYTRSEEHWDQTNALLGGFENNPTILELDADPSEPLGKIEPADDEE